MKVGFTGTQRGMSAAQRAELRAQLVGATELHHGDCIGADAEAHAIAQSLGIRIVIHPPEISAKRAFCKGAAVTYLPLPYLERNRHIVNLTARLIAAPKTAEEELRSGTWATVRYARQRRRPVTILFPMGLLR